MDDRVTGLQAGGDDYLVKPFAFSELLARLEAFDGGRREAGTPDTSLKVGDLELDLLSRAVKRAGRMIRLQPREFSLLEYLMRHVDQVVTRTMLLEGRLELSLRSADERHRRARQSASQQDRSWIRTAIAAHRTGRRIHVEYRGIIGADCTPAA